MGKIVNYKNQDYKSIKKQCLASGSLFEDSEFPANNGSLSYDPKTVPEGVEWKRPGEIVQNPKFVVDGVGASDFSQGSLGNCWFVAACACLASEKKCLKKVIPDIEEQDWGDDKGYAGIFHFNFFQLGQWYDVTIDDRLPTRDGNLLYVSSNTKNEFWSALLEKAYAKLFGDYWSLKSGHGSDALEDMMGGVSEDITLDEWTGDQKKKDELFDQLLEGYENRSLMTASIQGSKKEEVEAKRENGLVVGHAYSVTCINKVKLGSGLIDFFKNEKIQMIRLRNPWGNHEWTGAWSDESPEWKRISDSEKKDLGLVSDDNGEFWMSFDDFLKNFSSMDICHTINTDFFSLSRTYKESVFWGSWKKPFLAGGCGNHDTFLQNPQYLFDITDDEDVVMVSLSQQDSRIHREENRRNISMGFAVHKADLNRTCRMNDKLEKISSGPYSEYRSVFKRLTLSRGRYLLVPSSFEPGAEGNFSLRVYCKNNIKMRELLEDAPEPSGCCAKKPKMAVRLFFQKAVGLEKQDLIGGADPYLIIKCEGQEVRTPVCENTLNPEWNWRCTFYKTNPNSDIIIEVKNHNVIRDELMGTVNIMGASTKSRQDGRQAFPLMGVGKEASQYKPGKLYVELKNFTDLNKA